MLIVRGVNVFPGALEGIVRRFPAVDEFMIEVYRRDEMDEGPRGRAIPDASDTSAKVPSPRLR